MNAAQIKTGIQAYRDMPCKGEDGKSPEEWKSKVWRRKRESAWREG